MPLLRGFFSFGSFFDQLFGVDFYLQLHVFNEQINSQDNDTYKDNY